MTIISREIMKDQFVQFAYFSSQQQARGSVLPKCIKRGVYLISIDSSDHIDLFFTKALVYSLLSTLFNIQGHHHFQRISASTDRFTRPLTKHIL